MAIPQVFTQDDYSSVDFTNVSAAMLEVLKDFLTVKLNWDLMYEDLVSATKYIIVTNKGTGNFIKFIQSGIQLQVQAAQTWTDADTSVNLFKSYFLPCDYMSENFILIGTDKQFYLYNYSTYVVDGTSNPAGLWFFGDTIPTIENDPSAFVVTHTSGSDNQFDSSKGSIYNSSYAGTLLLAVESKIKAGSSFTQEGIYTADGSQYSLVGLGCLGAVYYSSSYNSMMTTNAELFVRACITDGTNSKIHSFMPGCLYSASLNAKFSAADYGTTITVAGESMIVVGYRNYFNILGIKLSDWDIL